MGKSKESKLKNYVNELKDELKNDSNKNKEKDPEFDKAVADDLKEELKEEKKIITITAGSIIILLLLFVLIGTILYLSFHKSIEKKFNDLINNIPVYKSQDNNNIGETDTNTNDDNSYVPDNSNNDSTNKGNDCKSSFSGTYKLNNEVITFESDGYFDLSSNNVTTATGMYTIKDNVINVDADYEDFSLGSKKFTYNISKDCKKLTEVNTGKIYNRK